MKSYLPLLQRLIAVTALCACAASASAGDRPVAVPGERFTASGELVPMLRSSDGRFAIGGSARFAPQAQSSDGRFTIKSTFVPTGNCQPIPDAVFANGFEP